MAYQLGQLILDTDYNQFVSDINEIYSTNTGPNFSYNYGQTAIASSVPNGSTITAAQWSNLFETVNRCASHQGTAVGDVPTSVNVGDTIAALDNPTTGLANIITTIRNNRNNVDLSQTTVTSGGQLETSQKTASWDNSITHTFVVNFGSGDNARYYFNAGGQIRMSITRTGSTAIGVDAEWSNLVSRMGTVFMDRTNTGTTGQGNVSNVGYHELTGTPQQLYSISGSGAAYGSELIRITAIADNAVGNISITITLTSAPGDIVSGTFTSLIDERRASGVNVSLPSPTVTTTSEL